MTLGTRLGAALAALLVLVLLAPAAASTAPAAKKKAKPTLSAKAVSVREDRGPAVITLKLSKKTTKTVKVAWSTVNGTATSGRDFTGADGRATIKKGKRSATIKVAITDDEVGEPTESFTVTLKASGVKLRTRTVKVTILDEDPAFPATISGTFGGSFASGSVTLTWQGRVTKAWQRKDPYTGGSAEGYRRYVTTAVSGTWSATGECSGSGTFSLATIEHFFYDSEIYLGRKGAKGWMYGLGLYPSQEMLCHYPDERPPFDLSGWVGGPHAEGGSLLYNSDSRGPESNYHSTDLRTFDGSLDITPGAHQTWTWDLTGSGAAY